MKFLIFIASLLLLSCGQNPAKENEDISKTETSKTAFDTVKKIPITREESQFHNTPDEKAVNEMLKRKFGNKWHVLNDNEAKWMKETFDYFIVPKRKESPVYPYITKGDYDGDGKADMAAVVIDSSKSSYQVAILLGKDKIEFWKEDIMVDAAISSIPKSTVEGMEGEKTRKLKLKGDGINVEYFEKASFVLYWDNSSFKRIQTGD
jgi:hypothetical protein